MKTNFTVYSYRIVVDNSSAPCIMNDLLSLCICKSIIRRKAKIGDIIFIINGSSFGEDKEKLLCVFKVDDVIDMKQYYLKYNDRIDCIYDDNLKQIENNFHSTKEIENDLKGKNALLSSNYVFFGNKSIDINDDCKDLIPTGRSHQSKKNDGKKDLYLKYFDRLINQYGIGRHGKHYHIKNKCSKNKCSKKCK